MDKLLDLIDLYYIYFARNSVRKKRYRPSQQLNIFQTAISASSTDTCTSSSVPFQPVCLIHHALFSCSQWPTITQWFSSTPSPSAKSRPFRCVLVLHPPTSPIRTRCWRRGQIPRTAVGSTTWHSWRTGPRQGSILHPHSGPYVPGPPCQR